MRFIFFPNKDVNPLRKAPNIQNLYAYRPTEQELLDEKPDENLSSAEEDLEKKQLVDKKQLANKNKMRYSGGKRLCRGK